MSREPKRSPPATGEEATTAGSDPPRSPDSRSAAGASELLGPADAAIASDPDQRWTKGTRIAIGGMGEVREARDRLLHRDVAIKTMHTAPRRSPRDAREFLDEARITAGLDHPGIVAVHDLLAPGGRLELVMQRVHGVTMTALFAEIHAQPLILANVLRVCRILIRACEAIGFAHSRGVIHCDLKPDNVMVGEHGEVYVMDWGVAHVLAGEGGEHSALLRNGKRARRKTRTAGGTVAYMAPEQARARSGSIGEWTDVHGLGGILHFFLCGRPPYAGGSLSTVHERPSDGIGSSIAARCIWPDTPPGLVAIATRALSPEPAARYPSMAALREDLEQFLDGGGWFATRDFAPGETIVDEGERGDSAFILVAGRCAVFKRVAGERSLLRHLAPGDVFGETAVVANEPRSATVVAESAVTVKIVTRDSLERELARNPWMAAFTLTLAARFLELDRRASASEASPPPLGAADDPAR